MFPLAGTGSQGGVEEIDIHGAKSGSDGNAKKRTGWYGSKSEGPFW